MFFGTSDEGLFFLLVVVKVETTQLARIVQKRLLHKRVVFPPAVALQCFEIGSVAGSEVQYTILPGLSEFGVFVHH